MNADDKKKAGAPPEDAVADRAAQDHDYADVSVSGQPARDIDYPADAIDNRDGDITPSAPDPHVDWDEQVQPERADEAVDDLGEGREAEGDVERGEAGEDLAGDIERGA